MKKKVDEFDKYNCFENLNLDLENKENETIQDLIKEDKQYMIDFFSKQPYYKEMMPKILKASRGTVFYHGLIKKGLKYNTDFFKIIMRSIKKVKDEKKIKSPKAKKTIGLYKLPKIRELMIRKKKIEKNNLIKTQILQLKNEDFNRYREQIKKQIFPSTTKSVNKSSQITKDITCYNTININNNLISDNFSNNSFFKNGNSTGKISQKSFFSHYNNDISTYYQSNNFNNLSRNKAFLNKIKYNNLNDNNNSTNLIYLINKCVEEIMSGKEVKGNVSNFNKNITRKIKHKLKTNKIENRDKKILEEKNKKKDKYIKQEENNYANIKRKINQKISNTLAYENRKELTEILKLNKNARSYMLHLNEMNKINKILGERRIAERQRIHKVKSLCDLGYKKNEYLNKQIDKINYKNKELNQLNKTIEIMSTNDNHTIKKEKNSIKGTLVQKLISLNDESCQKIIVGSSLNKFNNLCKKF